jgi:hypothetical protein
MVFSSIAQSHAIAAIEVGLKHCLYLGNSDAARAGNFDALVERGWIDPVVAIDFTYVKAHRSSP